MQRDVSFGSWLKQRRSTLELTQDGLAQLIHCSSATIRKIESGLRRPSREIAKLLAKHLDIAPHEYSAFVCFARGESSSDAFDTQAGPDKSRTASLSWKASQRSTHVPLPLTPLIGRADEVALLSHRIMHSQPRLLTLTGPAGVGKTRLALEVASNVAHSFADGVFFVALDIVADPSLVAHAIIHTVGLVEHGQQPPSTQLLTYFRDKHTLLILDNFEHIVSAAPLIIQLLTACPWLYVLVTSRLPLQVRGEQHYAVHPLAIPTSDQVVPFEEVADYSAVALFVNCAQAVKADWLLTLENAPAVIDLCQRLDGLPLAIELAAAHSCWLSPHNMIQQLCNNYPILFSKGFRDSSTRQQTLRDAIDWSYNLLDPATQHLFARLAVFCGGWTLGAAAICDQEASPGDESHPAHTAYLSRLLTLVDHNLVRQEETQTGEVRFTMLHTMREYAYEHLNGRGEMLMMQQRHARYFRDLAEHLEPLLRGEKQLAALQWIQQEYANFHAALSWYRSDPNGAEDGLRLAGALGEFWFIRNNFVQGHLWLQAFLDGDCQVSLAVRAKALRYAAVLASPQGDVAQALRWNQESLAAHQRLDDRWGIAYTLASLGDVQLWHNHNPDQGRALFTQSLSLARTIDDLWLLARVTWRVGMYNYYSGHDVAQAQILLEESLTAASAIHDLWGMSNALPHVANIAYAQGDLERTSALLEEALELARRIGNQRSIATTLNIMGIFALSDGKYQQAKACHEESLSVAQSAHLAFQQAAAWYFLGQCALHQHLYGEAHARLIESIKQHHTLNAKFTIVLCLLALADVACRTNHVERAAQLLATATCLLGTLDAKLTPAEQSYYEQVMSATYAQIDPLTWDRAWEEGQKVSVEHVIYQEEADVNNRYYSRMEGRGLSVELGRSTAGDAAKTSRWGK